MKSFILAVLLLIVPSAFSLTCQFCIEVTQLLQSSAIYLAPQSMVEQAVYLVCQKKYDSQQLCKDVSKQLTPLAIKSGVRSILKQGRICQKFCGKDFYKTFDLNNIQKQLEGINISKQKQALSDFQKVVLNDKQISDLKILHLTDVHLDLNYTQKTSTICSLPICCHIQNGYPQTPSTQAKPFGNIKCDTPLKLLDKALDYIQENIHDIDIVIVTGDYSAHNEWQKTPQTVKNVRELVQNKIKQKVHAQYIFTAPGNNQYLPDHQVDPSSVPEQTLKVYRVYQPDESKYVTFVSINTLFCDNLNLYLLQDQTQSIRQLKMLQKILQGNQNIYLMGHIPLSSDSCAQTYQLIFRTILQKYKHKILGQFYGHTHSDQFIVNTNPKVNTQVTSFSLLAGSLSPFGTGTSRFRVYDLDEKSFQIINYFDYQMKLNEEMFSLNYQFKKYYDIDAQDKYITFQLMASLQQKIKNDQNFRQKYANQLNGRQSKSLNAYCYTYDNKTIVSQCLNNQLSFTSQIFEYLQIIQGPWGSYGSMVQ